VQIRYPRPLRPGDRIGVTSPSAGVPEDLRPRLAFCVAWLRDHGYEVVLGACMDGSGVTSAPAVERAAELTEMLCDPSIAAVVPPWGGELAVEVLPHLDFEAIVAAEPTWLVGYSDTSTLLTPITLLTGTATIHGHNLMDTPYRLPPGQMPWYEVVALAPEATIEQSAAGRVRSAAAGFDRWQDGPEIATSTEYTLDEETNGWTLLGEGTTVDVEGRLIGGCVEVLGPLAGSRYGDLGALPGAESEGLIVYVEASEDTALNIARHLWSMRLAGWFTRARAVLVGRTHAVDSPGFTQLDAVRSALGDLQVPVVLDVDCGHVVPALALINGAHARIQIGRDGGRLTQRCV
jgi:muramoyltetrapeptide carboxypeptidase